MTHPLPAPNVKSSKKKELQPEKTQKKQKRRKKKKKIILYNIHVSIFIYFKCDSLFPPFLHSQWKFFIRF